MVGQLGVAACCLGLVATVAGPATGTSAGDFRVHYPGLMRAFGDIHATCEGGLWNQHLEGTSRFAVKGNLLATLYTTTWNETIVGSATGNPFRITSRYEQSAEDIVLGPGVYDLSWSPQGRVAFLPFGWPASRIAGEQEMLRFEAAAKNITAGLSLSGVEDGEYFVAASDGTVFPLKDALGVEARRISLENGTFLASGAASVLLYNLELHGPHGRLALAPRMGTASAPNGAVEVWRYEDQHLIIHASSLQWSDSAEGWVAGCSSLAGRILGTLTMVAASGEVSWNGESRSFRNTDVTIEGETEWAEESRNGVTSRGTGAFAMVAEDYRPITLPSSRESAVIVAASAGLALVVGAWLFYARLRQPALRGHPTRELVHLTIRENPFIRRSELQRRTQVPESTLRHHLRQLERRGLIVALASTARHIQYSTPEAATRPPPDGPADSLVARECREGPKPMAQLHRELVAQLGYARSGAWYALNRIIRDGKVETFRLGGRKWLMWKSRL